MSDLNLPHLLIVHSHITLTLSQTLPDPIRASCPLWIPTSSSHLVFRTFKEGTTFAFQTKFILPTCPMSLPCINKGLSLVREGVCFTICCRDLVGKRSLANKMPHGIVSHIFLWNHQHFSHCAPAHKIQQMNIHIANKSIQSLN